MSSFASSNPSSGQPDIPGLHETEFSQGSIPEEPLDGASEKMLMSPSSLISYMSDPARYYFKKILKRREPWSPAAVEGSTYHAGIEFALEHKRKLGHLPLLPDTLEFVKAYWDAEVKKFPAGTRPDPERLEYINHFFTSQIYDVLGELAPKFIEKHVTATINKTVGIHGYIDLVHTNSPGAFADFDPRTDVLMDFKSKAVTPSKGPDGGRIMANWDRFQLTLYAWMLSGGNYSVKSRIIYLVKNKTPKIVKVDSLITAEEQQQRIRTVVKITDAIRDGHFPPNYGHWACSPGRCAFYKDCHELL